MNINKEIIKITDDFNKTLSTIELCCDFSDIVDNVNGSDILCKPTKTFEELLSILHKVSKKYGKYSCLHYNMLDNETFYVNYRFDRGFSLCLYTSDVKNALESIGNGKCRIIASTETKKSIVCDIK